VDLDVAVLEAHGTGDGQAEAFGDAESLSVVRGTVGQHHELVAGVAEDPVVVAHRGPESLRHLDEQLVAGRCPSCR